MLTLTELAASLLVRTADGPARLQLSSGQWLHANQNERSWGSRADELPSRARHDLRCLRVKLGSNEFPAAVEACARARGVAATTIDVLQSNGDESVQARLLVGAGLVYVAGVAYVCVRRRNSG